MRRIKSEGWYPSFWPGKLVRWHTLIDKEYSQEKEGLQWNTCKVIRWRFPLNLGLLRSLHYKQEIKGPSVYVLSEAAGGQVSIHWMYEIQECYDRTRKVIKRKGQRGVPVVVQRKQIQLRTMMGTPSFCMLTLYLTLPLEDYMVLSRSSTMPDI